MIKKIIPILFCFVLIFVFSFNCFASSGYFSAYGSVLNNSTQAKQLFEAWSASSLYDPLYDWIVFTEYNSSSRSTDYYLLASEKIYRDSTTSYSNSNTYCFYLTQVSGTPTYYSISLSSYDNFVLNSSNYSFLGTVDYCSLPDYAGDYKFNSSSYILMFVICFAILFFIFRIRFDRERGFKL